MVSDRISSLSSTAELYNLAIPTYKEALSGAGHPTESVKFTANQPAQNRNAKNRRRKVKWFNPPFNSDVNSNVSKMFQSIIDRAFPKDHPYLHKLFNRRNMKCSYSTTPNLKQIIAAHNRRLLSRSRTGPSPPGNHQIQPPRTCNCRGLCPLNGQCLIEGVVYRADISTNDPNDERFYHGSTGSSFKTRHNGHNLSLNNEKYKHQTTLSTHAWQLKDEGKDYDIKWSIVARAAPYRPGSGFCNLCNAEKTEIASHINDRRSLNKRTELLAKCRHRRKWLLSSLPEG